MTNTLNKESKKPIQETFYYMTQYAAFMDDESYYQSMRNIYEKLDNQKLYYLCNKLAFHVEDKLNQVLYQVLYKLKDNNQLDLLIEIWELLKDNNLQGLCDLLDIDYWSWDDAPYSPDQLEELADCDFKQNGVNANAHYWFKEINYNYDVHVFNGYDNGFDYYDNINDYISYYFEDYCNLLDEIINYINLD